MTSPLAQAIEAPLSCQLEAPLLPALADPEAFPHNLLGRFSGLSARALKGLSFSQQRPTLTAYIKVGMPLQVLVLSVPLPVIRRWQYGTPPHTQVLK